MLAVLIALLTADPSPTPAPVLEGRVQGPDGKPIAGAVVVARSKTATWTDPPLSTTTDAAGSFRLPVKTGAAHDVWAHARGLAVAKRENVRPGPSLIFRLENGGAIEGVVRNSSGAPVENARVETEPNDRVPEWVAGVGTATATSDRNGRFRLTGLDRRPQSIVASARGFGRAQQEGVVVGRRVELFLVPGGSVSGVVVDADGRAVADVVVRLEGTQPHRWSPSARTTDAKGGFVFDGLLMGTYILIARHLELGVALSPGIEIDEGADVRRDVILLPGVAVTGRLVDPEEQPVSGRVVVGEIAGESAPRALADALGAEAGADGRFRIDGVPLGPAALSVSAPGFAPRRVDFDARPAPPGTDVGDVTMDPGLRLRGRVRSKAGPPVSEAQIFGHQRIGMTSLRAQGTSDEAGAFVMGGLKPGRVHLSVWARGFGSLSTGVEAGASDLDLVLDPAGSIAGTVVDENGAAVPSFRVQAERGNYEGDTQDEFSPDDGRFVLESVGEGLWTVSVNAVGYGQAAVSDVAVRPGKVSDIGRVRLKRGATVRGQVVAFDDSPVPGATIRAVATQPMVVHVDGPTVSSDAQGLFELNGVAPGSTDVIATHPSYAESRVRNVDVDPTRATEVKVVLAQGGRIEGTARRRDGGALAGAFVYAQQSDGGFSMDRRSPVAPDGSFAIERVPAGPIDVALMLGSGTRFSAAASRQVDVREGETIRVDLVVASILVSGRVSRGDGVVPGARVNLRSRTLGYSYADGSAAVPAGGSAGPERGTGVTNDDGFYQLLADAPGSTWATVEAGSPPSQHVFPDIELPDADTFTLDFDLGSSTLSGTVVDAETNSAVADASVVARPRAGRGQRAMSVTADDGHFRIEVEPGDYHLSARREGYGAATIDVSPGPSGLSEILIALEKGLQIRGRLVDARGNGVPGAYVSATGTDSSGGVATMADGHFWLTGLKPANHTLFADAGRLGFATRTVTAPADDIVLQLSQGGHVRIRVLAVDGTAVAQATVQVAEVDGLAVSANEAEKTNAEGFAELAAPSGLVTLEAWSSEKQVGSGRVVVTVPEGQTVPAEVTLKPAETTTR